ncbi:unnamed protein product [Paramecium sonneborni]|uniref:Uncharacterized protein n=1 Tax=Paramecium sonneborni TaxID=65129 RepID=A0A8S1RPV2_9CILI|nr:unnamed protein product [Paramecium sonneborni]
MISIINYQSYLNWQIILLMSNPELQELKFNKYIVHNAIKFQINQNICSLQIKNQLQLRQLLNKGNKKFKVQQRSWKKLKQEKIMILSQQDKQITDQKKVRIECLPPRKILKITFEYISLQMFIKTNFGYLKFHQYINYKINNLIIIHFQNKDNEVLI